MKYLLLGFLSVCSVVSAQSHEEKYRDLAKYVIIMTTLEDNYHDTAWLRNALEQVEEMVKSDDYQYDVEIVDGLEKFHIISIRNKMGPGLHGYPRYTFLVDTTAGQSDKFEKIERTNLLESINKKITPFLQEFDKYSIIMLYNKMYEHFHSGYKIVEFYREENKQEFEKRGLQKYLKEVLSKDTITRRSSYHHYRLEREWDGSAYDFFSTTYEFDCKKLKVTHYLDIRVK